MSANILTKLTTDFRRGVELDHQLAESLLDALITATDEGQIANLLTAWNTKGVSENEIYEFSRILRVRMKRVHSQHESFADIVGTGGSKVKTFNVSTAAAFVIAGAGIPVAKHGNKAATSNSGSADVLAELGIVPSVDPGTAERCLNDIGICFMFAPNHHRLSPTLAKVRRSLGFPTIFNCVGPLCNPASASHQLIGVWDEDLVPKMASSLARLGTNRSWIVRGEGGLDEIALNGTTTVAEVNGDLIRPFQITPEEFGIEVASTESLRSNNANHSAGIIKAILSGSSASKPAEDIVLLNAAASIHLAKNLSPKEAAELARESIKSGRAYSKLEELAAATRK